MTDDPQYARIKVTEADITYGLLNELRDKLLYPNGGFQRDPLIGPPMETVIEEFLAQFPTRDALLRWGHQFANSDTDEAHAVWSMDHHEAEVYTEERVNEILRGGHVTP